MRKLFAIIDIETTGGLIRRDKITEIAIALHDGEKVIDKFETLINPERSIPEFISNMTGITNRMVSQAPRFYEVGKKIVQMTEGAVFVAHNVRFDYSFIREEFQRLGYTYSRRQLCTARLARKVLPGLRGYGLDKLTRHFGIQIKNRHRAMGDVNATVDVFENILRHEDCQDCINDIINLGIRESRLPENISLDDLHALPEETGVYYFHDKYGRIVYVGKSINIRKRVMQHFAKISNKAAKLQQRVHDITYEITGSELVALLLENQEIKTHQPEINRAQRRNSYPYAIYSFVDDDGYLNFKVERKNKVRESEFKILHEYPKAAHARGHLKRIVSEFELCQNKCDKPTGPGSCFNYKIHQCHGACVTEEVASSYNRRAEAAMQYLQKSVEGSMLIIDQGRASDERALIAVRDGIYYGYGYIDNGARLENLESAFDHIKAYPPTPESIKIVNWYLTDQRAERVIAF